MGSKWGVGQATGRLYQLRVIPGFTARYNVNTLVYYDVHATYVEAARREKRFKNWCRQWKLNIIKELNNYKWFTDKNGNKLNKPVDMFNHALDAVRYVALNKMKADNKGSYNISIMSNDGSVSKITTGQSQKIYAIR